MGTGRRWRWVAVVGSREGGDHWPSVDCVFRHGYDVNVVCMTSNGTERVLGRLAFTSRSTHFIIFFLWRKYCKDKKYVTNSYKSYSKIGIVLFRII